MPFAIRRTWGPGSPEGEWRRRHSPGGVAVDLRALWRRFALHDATAIDNAAINTHTATPTEVPTNGLAAVQQYTVQLQYKY